MNFFSMQITAQEAYAAVDIVADPAGRNDSFFGIKGSDSADRETIAPMDVWHGHGWADDAGQGCDVADLLEGLFLTQVLHHCWRGENQAVGPHGSFAGDAPTA